MKEKIDHVGNMLVPLVGMMISLHLLGWLIHPWYMLPSNALMVPIILIIFRKPKVVEGVEK